MGSKRVSYSIVCSCYANICTCRTEIKPLCVRKIHTTKLQRKDDEFLLVLKGYSITLLYICRKCTCYDDWCDSCPGVCCHWEAPAYDFTSSEIKIELLAETDVYTVLLNHSLIG